jgi:hypothetical protein|tara:strand:+ start:1394 stop:1783 length:390 start_codon:yes stop_codon:yes gene_type:complete
MFKEVMMTKIMTGLLYRKLNLDLLDWDGYVLIRSISYAKDSDMYAVVELNTRSVYDTDLHRFHTPKVDVLVSFLSDKGWVVDSVTPFDAAEPIPSFTDSIRIKLELPKKVESTPYIETGDYDKEESKDA